MNVGMSMSWTVVRLACISWISPGLPGESRLARSLVALLAAAVLPLLPAHAAPLDLSTVESVAGWLTHYYEAPQPKLVSRAILVLSKEGALQKEETAPVTFGFLAGILAKNKAIAPSLVKDLTALPDEEQKILVLGIWYSGRPDTKKLLQGLLATMPANKDNVDNLLRGTPVLLTQIPLLQGSWVVDGLWGNFMATGDAEPVKRIMAALPWADLQVTSVELSVGRAARWSLIAHAAQHPRVLAICRREVTKQPPEVAKALKEVIAEAEENRKKLAAP